MPKHERTGNVLPGNGTVVPTGITPPPTIDTNVGPYCNHPQVQIIPNEDGNGQDTQDNSAKRRRLDTLDDEQLNDLAAEQQPTVPLGNQPPNEIEPTASQESLAPTELYNSQEESSSESGEEDGNSDSEADSENEDDESGDESSYPSLGSPGSSSAPDFSDEEGEPGNSEDESQNSYNPSSNFSSEHSEPPSPYVSEDEGEEAAHAGSPSIPNLQGAVPTAPATAAAHSQPNPSDEFFDYMPGEKRHGPTMHLYHNRPDTPRPQISSWEQFNSSNQIPDETIQTTGTTTDHGVPPHEGPSWWC